MRTKSSIIGLSSVVIALIAIPFAYAAQNRAIARDKKTFQTTHDKSEKPVRYLSSNTVESSALGAVSGSAIPEKREYLVDNSVNPCDDFHKYVCGQAEESFQLRPDRSAHVFAFEDSEERLLEKKKTFFKNIDAEKKLSQRSLQMKQFYKACMNEKESARQERIRVKNLTQELDRIKTVDQFIELNKKNMLNEKWSFISYDMSPNVENPLVYDINFDVSLMFLPEHSYYDDKDLVKAYAQLITEFFMTVFPDGNKAEFIKRAEKIVEFESHFRAFYPTPNEFRKRWTDPKYFSREEFFKKTSVLNLKDFFSKNIPSKTLIRDFEPEAFQFLQKELVSANLQVFKDIYFFRNARTFMDDAYPELYKKRMAFSHQYLGGSPERPDRQERCTTSVMGAFSRELDAELLPRLFPQFPKNKMLTVVDKIRSSILQGIEKNNWLSPESKEGALKKIKTARLQIIQPTNEKEWDFKPIQTYSTTDQYENNKKLALLGHKKALQKFKEGVNQEAWGMGPLTVNAYYSPTANKFVMPIGILQYPFFVAEGDVIENLGAVGVVVAHELGHAIDDEGSKFDADGKLKQWMSEEDVVKFKKRGQKLVQQFNQVGHNGELTLGENVADLVGLTFSYQAAFPKNEGTSEDKKKFFTAYGRLWCSVVREKMKENWLKTDPHSLGPQRINEQVKHQAGFSEAFSCKPKNKLYMSEAERIKIW